MNPEFHFEVLKYVNETCFSGNAPNFDKLCEATTAYLNYLYSVDVPDKYQQKNQITQHPAIMRLQRPVQNWRGTQPKFNWDCFHDVFHFFDNYYFIRTPRNIDAQTMKLYQYQRDGIETLLQPKPAIICAARQLGTTTTVLGVMLWRALSEPNITILIVGKPAAQISELSDRLEYSLNNLPAGMYSAVVADITKGYVSFKNGSRIIIKDASNCVTRGITFDYLWIDSAAYISHAVMTKLECEIFPQSRHIILSSSAGSAEGSYYTIWTSSDWNKIHWPYTVHPERDNNWAESTRKLLGPRFEQEFECKFKEK